jgi:hypothetical protein
MQHARADADVFGESTVDIAGKNAGIGAQLVVAGAAVTTAVTGYHRLDAYAVAGRDAGHTRSNFVDDPADFVAGCYSNQWQVTSEAVHVAAAHSAECDLYAHLSSSRDR